MSSVSTFVTFSSQTPGTSIDFSSLVFINVATQVPLKLTATNYFTWKAQFDAILTGYDLSGYIDGTRPCPPSTIPVASTASSNPAHIYWVRQDKLILGALLASLSPEIALFIASAATSCSAWSKLATTYAKPSRSRLLRLRARLVKPQGSRTITDYMFDLKGAATELTMLNEPVHEDEVTFYIKNGLNSDLKDISAAIRTQDISISFEIFMSNCWNMKLFFNGQTLMATIQPSQPMLPTALLPMAIGPRANHSSIKALMVAMNTEMVVVTRDAVSYVLSKVTLPGTVLIYANHGRSLPNVDLPLPGPFPNLKPFTLGP